MAVHTHIPCCLHMSVLYWTEKLMGAMDPLEYMTGGSMHHVHCVCGVVGTRQWHCAVLFTVCVALGSQPARLPWPDAA